MNKYKYKYFMNGMIDGTDGKTYEIEVPSPFLYDSELAAMKDSELKCRIILTSGMIEPELAVINKENIIKTYTDIEKEKLYYVDNEAYCIKKIDVNCETKME